VHGHTGQACLAVQFGQPGLAFPGNEDLGQRGARGQRLAEGLRALGEKGPGTLPQCPFAELPGRPDPGRLNAQRLTRRR